MDKIEEIDICCELFLEGDFNISKKNTLYIVDINNFYHDYIHDYNMIQTNIFEASSIFRGFTKLQCGCVSSESEVGNEKRAKEKFLLLSNEFQDLRERIKDFTNIVDNDEDIVMSFFEKDS